MVVVVVVVKAPVPIRHVLTRVLSTRCRSRWSSAQMLENVGELQAELLQQGQPLDWQL